jgi:hypothetical protein
MIYNVLLISEQKLIDNTAINGSNVDTSELRFCIQQAQTLFLQESLGTNLYEKLLQLVDDNQIGLSGNTNYKNLLDNFVQPTLIQYAYYIALDNFFVKWANVGLVQNRTEQGGSIDLKTLQYLKTNAKNNAEFNDNLLRRHLIFKSGEYPEYVSGNLNDGQLPPETNSAFKSSITTPGQGYYYGSNWNWKYNAMGPLCAGSGFPTWYGHSNNSGGLRQ